MKVMTYANGQPLCSTCAMVEYKKVSREYRPRVAQWEVFEEVSVPNTVHIQCTKCHKEVCHA